MKPIASLALQAVSTDDIASLKQYLAGASFEYVDVASEQVHKELLSRWPLLSELEAWYQSLPDARDSQAPLDATAAQGEL